MLLYSGHVLNGKMQVLIGQKVEWGMKIVLPNLFVWVCIFILVFVLKIRLKDKWKKVQQFISLSLTAVQFVALISLLLTTDALYESENNSYGYVSNEGMLELSQENNVIVFILDYFDGRSMDAILAEDEDFLHSLQGFTYYPNATSVHSRTYPSITYLLTGNMCYFDKLPQDYVNEAYENSSFLPALYENGIEIGLYTYPNYIGNSAKTQICKYVFNKPNLNFKEVIRVFGKMVLYGDMPYLVPHKTAVPILFVKPAGASDEELKVSDAPVSHTEFISTILDGFSLDYQDYGRTIYDIGETEDRERFYYYSALYTNEDGEVELREYKVDGDSRNAENYHYTGKKWDIQYSENVVATK